MGKRVNFSARSVLAPDPYIAVDEVGVPLDFAKHLTYPVPVTSWNVDFLRKLVSISIFEIFFFISGYVKNMIAKFVREPVLAQITVP